MDDKYYKYYETITIITTTIIILKNDLFITPTAPQKSV